MMAGVESVEWTEEGASGGFTAKAGQNEGLGEGVEKAGVDAGVQNVEDVGRGREGGERALRRWGEGVERVGRWRRGRLWMPASRLWNGRRRGTEFVREPAGVEDVELGVCTKFDVSKRWVS
jgi:hypothetical protein